MFLFPARQVPNAARLDVFFLILSDVFFRSLLVFRRMILVTAHSSIFPTMSWVPLIFAKIIPRPGISHLFLHKLCVCKINKTGGKPKNSQVSYTHKSGRHAQFWPTHISVL